MQTDILELFVAVARRQASYYARYGCPLAPMPRREDFPAEAARARSELTARRATPAAGPTAAAKARKRARSRRYMATLRATATPAQADAERARQRDKQARRRARGAA